MTKAVWLICEIAFAGVNIVRVTGLVYAPNVSSRNVLERNGFVRKGIERNAVYKDGEVYDLYLYGKLK